MHSSRVASPKDHAESAPPKSVPRLFDLTFAVVLLATAGSLGATTATYSTGNLAVPIPDVSQVDVPITVPDAGVITDVNVRVRLNHTFDGDLVLQLFGPDGTFVNLAVNRGGSGANFGTGSLDCAGTSTVFDDSAASSISAGIAPFAGTFRPESPLAAFNLKPTNGTWKLRAIDTAALDTGTIRCVNLVLTFNPVAQLLSAKSRRFHTAAGTFDLPLSLSPLNPTTEPRQGPVHTVVFTFDNAITGANVAITEGTAVAGAPAISGNDVTINLTGVTNQQYVTVSLTNISDTGGGAGGSAAVRLGFLLGDVNQNRVVTVSDLGLVNAQLAQPVTATNFLKDVNATGTLTVADKGVINANLAKALPAP